MVLISMKLGKNNLCQNGSKSAKKNGKINNIYGQVDFIKTSSIAVELRE